jgi:hypothetical protein
MKISQPERGGNGERICVVNQWLRRRSREFAVKTAVSLHPIDTPVAENPRSSRIVPTRPEMFLTVQARHRFLHVR